MGKARLPNTRSTGSNCSSPMPRLQGSELVARWPVRSQPGLASAASRPTREQECSRTHTHAEQDKDQPETEREGEVSLAGLQRDRGSHGAGEATDIAADDDDRTDF